MQRATSSSSRVPAAAVATSSAAAAKSEQSQSAPKSLAHALLPDLPLLMHGSGDVLPEDVHPHSVATLAQLIEKYVASLVSAAMDAHDVFTDGEVVGGGACFGPPPYGATGSEDSDDENDDEGGDEMSKKRKAKDNASKRKRKKKIDYWDVPLPPPGQEDDDDSSVNSEISDSDDDAPLLSPHRRLPSTTSLLADSTTGLQGIAPVDLHVNERTRSHYVAAPTVMDARSFIFPICHDAVLYQRIKEVQASRRAISRDVVDSVLMEVLKEEGVNEGRRGAVDMWGAILGGRANDANKKKDGAATVKDKLEKKKDDTSGTADGKGDNNDGANVVGAGLVDPDVDPSWPGLNALLRGRLW